MGKKPNEIVKELRKFKLKLIKHIAVQKMILFGSTARGQAGKDSDIDLIFVSPQFKGVSPLGRAYAVSKQWDLDYPKDFLCYTPAEFRKMEKLSIVVREAIREGIEI
ncbi:nucleotidyltransferase domain-containing protein [Candidatus Woesearchaeota archaeon]|nr:nucleotidyltransferase domain-containing protein [Candidatus Woesearchaeota archaeon]